ncbi:hypothetical protein NDU88_003023 [Pleurodeles waltl]|uniref:Uncharacterized protein n=1 Tax=Pleurodeles waltl TaxID=8319 RepID=A0AAV7M5W9_PLEWA|nr:hypothetical protein NDU88_003023 [Pleurodeles waltl]
MVPGEVRLRWNPMTKGFHVETVGEKQARRKKMKSVTDLPVDVDVFLEVNCDLRFEWSPECDEAFKSVKDDIVRLRWNPMTKGFHVETVGEKQARRKKMKSATDLPVDVDVFLEVNCDLRFEWSPECDEAFKGKMCYDFMYIMMSYGSWGSEIEMESYDQGIPCGDGWREASEKKENEKCDGPAGGCRCISGS